MREGRVRGCVRCFISGEVCGLEGVCQSEYDRSNLAVALLDTTVNLLPVEHSRSTQSSTIDTPVSSPHGSATRRLYTVPDEWATSI